MLYEFGNLIRLTHKEERSLLNDLSFMTPEQQSQVKAEIHRRLDEIVRNPSQNWGSITNTSIEGGKTNELTGEPGDWRGTPLQHVYDSCEQNDEEAALAFGRIFKSVVIERPEPWGGYRSDEDHPTFPNRGILLRGKTYYLLTQH